MKTKRSSVLAGMLALSILQFAVVSSLAQIATNGNVIIVNNFDTADQVTNNKAHAWQNWYGTAYSNVLWSVNDASNNVNSGSLEIVAYFPDAGVGGNYGSQFLAIDGFGPFFPPLPGNGAATNYYATNFSCDVQVAPYSLTNQFGQFPTLEFGTATTNYTSAFDFGQLTLYSTNTNWVHVSFAIPASANWVQIPGVFIKAYSSLTGVDVVYVDNITFSISQTTNAPAPPVVNIQKPTVGLRMFAGTTASIYDRQELTTWDHNEGWIGAGTTYPVTYSYTLKSFPTLDTNGGTEIFRFHIFLIPNTPLVNPITGNMYIDYQAPNMLWLNVQAQTSVSITNVTADIQWKVANPNANPNHTDLTITNATALGTWTLTFNSATTGTLTAPGASPVAFVLSDASAATDFANPVTAIFGVEPDSGFGQGKYADVASISTHNVAGVNINDNFTTDSVLNTNIWDASNSLDTNSVVLVTTNAAYWVYWNAPAVGFVLGTKAAVNTNIVLKTPDYYANYVTNGPGGPLTAPFTHIQANNIWALIPNNALPTVNTLSNGVPSANGFFELSSPGPAQ